MLAIRKPLIVLFGMLCAVSHLTTAAAGPSFNNTRKQLEKLSRDAGTELQASFVTFHDMLYWLEQLDIQKVEARRLDSLKRIDQALVLLRALAEKAPKQELILRPQSKNDEDAVGRLGDRLRSRKLEFPKTEAELAQLAVTVVATYRNFLAEVKFTGRPSDYHPLRQIIVDKSFVEEVGILSSIAWYVSEKR